MPEKAAGPPIRRVLVRRYQLAGSVAAIAAGAVGLLVLVGWAADSEPLKRLIPGLVAMNPATAVAFLLAGSALALRDLAGGRAAWARRVAWGCAAAVVAIGLSRLVGYLGAFDVGLDRLLFADRLAAETPVNRMAPNTAAAFVFTGAAMLALDRADSRATRAAEALAVLTLLLSLLALAGYAYRVPNLTGVSGFIPMALNTAAAFLATSLAVLFAEPERGLTRVLVVDAEGGRVARLLLPAALALPVVLAWVGMQGHARGLFDTQTAISAMVAMGALVLCTLIWWTAETLIRSETLRSRVELREARLQRSLRHRAQQIEAANAELEAFSYSVSHDLRAPLRSITGFSQALLEDHADRLDEDGQDYLQRVVRAGQRMAGLIDDLLRLSLVTRAEMQRAEVDLSAMADEILTQLRAANPDRAVEAVVEDGLLAHGDPRLLRVALDNLIENAWKYTGRSAAARIEVGRNGATPEGAPVFFVRDNGAGFDMAYAHKLFSPFQRLHADAEFQGSGIGLATARRVVRRHGGRAWAEAEIGQGATFFFTLDPAPETASG